MDALSAAVPLRIILDVQLTLIASPFYRRGSQPVREFGNASATLEISDGEITSAPGSPALDLYLIESAYANSVPWIHNLPLKINFA